MVGIAGLLAKRKQAAVTTQEPQNNSTRNVSSSTPSNDDIDINIDLNDPFSFDQRPSTSCSFEFSGSYMESDSFDNYNGADADGRGDIEVDGRDFEQIVKAPPAAVDAPEQEKDMEMISMPPPPPRSKPAPDKPNTQNEQVRALDLVVIVSDLDPPEDFMQEDAGNATKDGAMEGFLITDDIPNQPSAEAGDSQYEPPSPAFPSTATDTPAKNTISPGVASLRLYGSPIASEFTLQTPLPAVTPPAHELTLPCGASAVRTCDVSAVTPHMNEDHTTGQDEGFDEMQVRLLHDLQVVKDKHLDSEEHMMEMEVSLEHVIASINRQILQMQEMHDELDEIDDAQEEIVAMHPSRL